MMKCQSRKLSIIDPTTGLDIIEGTLDENTTRQPVSVSGGLSHGPLLSGGGRSGGSIAAEFAKLSLMSSACLTGDNTQEQENSKRSPANQAFGPTLTTSTLNQKAKRVLVITDPNSGRDVIQDVLFCKASREPTYSSSPVTPVTSGCPRRSSENMTPACVAGSAVTLPSESSPQSNEHLAACSSTSMTLEQISSISNTTSWYQKLTQVLPTADPNTGCHVVQEVLNAKTVAAPPTPHSIPQETPVTLEAANSIKAEFAARVAATLTDNTSATASFAQIRSGLQQEQCILSGQGHMTHKQTGQARQQFDFPPQQSGSPPQRTVFYPEPTYATHDVLHRKPFPTTSSCLHGSPVSAVADNSIDKGMDAQVTTKLPIARCSPTADSIGVRAVGTLHEYTPPQQHNLLPAEGMPPQLSDMPPQRTVFYSAPIHATQPDKPIAATFDQNKNCRKNTGMAPNPEAEFGVTHDALHGQTVMTPPTPPPSPHKTEDAANIKAEFAALVAATLKKNTSNSESSSGNVSGLQPEKEFSSSHGRMEHLQSWEAPQEHLIRLQQPDWSPQRTVFYPTPMYPNASDHPISNISDQSRKYNNTIFGAPDSNTRNKTIQDVQDGPPSLTPSSCPKSVSRVGGDNIDTQMGAQEAAQPSSMSSQSSKQDLLHDSTEVHPVGTLHEYTPQQQHGLQSEESIAPQQSGMPNQRTGLYSASINDTQADLTIATTSYQNKNSSKNTVMMSDTNADLGLIPEAPLSSPRKTDDAANNIKAEFAAQVAAALKKNTSNSESISWICSGLQPQEEFPSTHGRMAHTQTWGAPQRHVMPLLHPNCSPQRTVFYSSPMHAIQSKLPITSAQNNNCKNNTVSLNDHKGDLGVILCGGKTVMTPPTPPPSPQATNDSTHTEVNVPDMRKATLPPSANMNSDHRGCTRVQTADIVRGLTPPSHQQTHLQSAATRTTQKYSMPSQRTVYYTALMSANVSQRFPTISSASDPHFEKSKLKTGHDAIHEVLGENSPPTPYLCSGATSVSGAAEDCYRMDSCPRGRVLVINISQFGKSRFSPRMASEADVINVCRVFKSIGLSVEDDKRNHTAQGIRDRVTQFVNADEQRVTDCCILVLMSHGDGSEFLYGSDAKSVSVRDIIDILVAASADVLKEKPKMIVLQACRGESYDHGLNTTDGDEGQIGTGRGQSGKGQPNNWPTAVTRVPSHSDIVVAYPTFEDNVAYRNVIYGSWFIQDLCSVFEEYAAKEHVLDMLTRVNQRVSQRFDEKTQGVQIPVPSFTLRKKWFFRPSTSSP